MSKRAKFQKNQGVGLATLCAAGAPALIVFPFGSIFMALPAFLVALVHVLVLGLPLFFLFRRLNWVNPISAIAAGGLVGAIPILSLEFSFLPSFVDLSEIKFAGTQVHFGSASVDLLIPGIFAGFGAASGFAFWGGLHVSGAKEKVPDISCFSD